MERYDVASIGANGQQREHYYEPFQLEDDKGVVPQTDKERLKCLGGHHR